MKIEIPLTEVQDFLSNHYDKNVALKNIGEDKIEVDYLVSLILKIKEVKRDEVIFQYEVSGIVNLLVKGAHFLLEKKIDDTPIEWDSNTNEVAIDLKKVQAMNNFLKVFFISDLSFVNENIVLVFNMIKNIE